MSMQEALCWKMKMLRKKRGISLEKFAEELGISKTTLQNIERGRANPTLETVRQIAKQLNVPPLSLLSEEYDTDMFLTARVILGMLDSFDRLSSEKQCQALETLDQLIKILAKEKES